MTTIITLIINKRYFGSRSKDTNTQPFQVKNTGLTSQQLGTPKEVISSSAKGCNQPDTSFRNLKQEKREEKKREKREKKRQKGLSYNVSTQSHQIESIDRPNCSHITPKEEQSYIPQDSDYTYLSFSNRNLIIAKVNQISYYRSWEHNGTCYFQFHCEDSKLSKALNNHNVAIDPFCDRTEDSVSYDEAVRIIPKEPGILDKDMHILKKAILIIKS